MAENLKKVIVLNQPDIIRRYNQCKSEMYKNTEHSRVTDQETIKEVLNFYLKNKNDGVDTK